MGTPRDAALQKTYLPRSGELPCYFPHPATLFASLANSGTTELIKLGMPFVNINRSNVIQTWQTNMPYPVPKLNYKRCLV